jgi:hypothetical protein
MNKFNELISNKNDLKYYINSNTKFIAEIIIVIKNTWGIA